MEIYLIIWGAVFAAMVIAELNSFQLVSIWFAAGAAAAFITAIFGAEMWLQLIIFISVSLVFLFATRPILRKFKVHDAQPTDINIDIGKTVVVVEEINNTIDKGRARLNGVNWKAVSVNDSVIPEGSIVKIQDIRGTKLYVDLCKKN